MDPYQFVLRLPPDLAKRVHQAARRLVEGEKPRKEDAITYAPVDEEPRGRRGARAGT